MNNALAKAPVHTGDGTVIVSGMNNGFKHNSSGVVYQPLKHGLLFKEAVTFKIKFKCSPFMDKSPIAVIHQKKNC